MRLKKTFIHFQGINNLETLEDRTPKAMRKFPNRDSELRKRLRAGLAQELLKLAPGNRCGLLGPHTDMEVSVNWRSPLWVFLQYLTAADF